MENQNNNVTMGKRIKDIAKVNGYKNVDMAKLLNYSSEKTISAIYSNRIKLDDERVRLIAKTFNVRYEYLKCVDEFKTFDEYLQAEQSDLKAKYSITFSFLLSMGYEIYFEQKEVPAIEIWEDLDEIHKEQFFLELSKEKELEKVMNILKNYKISILSYIPKDKDYAKHLIDAKTKVTNEFIVIKKDNIKKTFTRDDFIRFANSIYKSVDFMFDNFF